ncbi:MAG: hypothetical protein U9R02_09690 [Thermodesulfobacteriota bacterium]|nr:hypothetical protein [Thermodesulfobacteriota bacterium]
MVVVHGLKLEIGKYKLAEALSDIVWRDFDKWNKKVQAKFPISNFNVP